MNSTMLKTAITFAFVTTAALIAPIPASYAAAPGPATDCEIAHPIRMVATESLGRNVPANRTMTVTLIGPIANTNKLKHGGKQRVTICEGARLEYRAESTAGSASCTLDRRAMPPKGLIKVDAGVQRLVCTDKPDGSDVDHIQIVGVNR